MDPTKILSLLEQLDDDIDDIEDAVAPFIQKTIPEFASKLPLLDKAKLYTLVTYAIESILFCTIFHHFISVAFRPCILIHFGSIPSTQWCQCP